MTILDACMLVYIHCSLTCCTGLSTKSAKPQSIQSLPMPVAVKFSEDKDIDYAFNKLSAVVTDIIQHINFSRLQRACIERARTPKMLHKSNEIVPNIQVTDSFERLCSMLANTSYWNFLDIRMMEAMATASMIPAAQETIENFKKTFFSMTLKKAAPYFPVIKVKPSHTELHEDLDSEMTIGELHKHRFYLETEILETGPDTCTICRIMIGSVAIVWQIHVDHAHQAYSRLKRFHYQSSLQAIRFMSIPETEKWEGLPFLWHGQDIGEIGPIETSTCVRQEPYPLPQGFEWSILSSSNFDEIIQLCTDCNPGYSLSRKYLKWLISSPLYKKGCLLGIRSSTSKKLVWFTASTSYHIRIGGKLLSMIHLVHVVDAKNQKNHFYNAIIKETMRMFGREGIFQATILTKQCVIPKSVITHDMYVCDLRSYSLPYTSPRTVGLRRMKPSDVPKAFTLTNQYTSQFEIGQVFQSEEEFSHWFLSPLRDNLTTYVVEEPNSGNITDMFSSITYDYESSKAANVIALVITKSSPKQLITDLLVCMKQQNVTYVSLFQYGLKKHLFTDFSKMSGFTGQQFYWLFYNYRYPEVDNVNHCLFGQILDHS